MLVDTGLKSSAAQAREQIGFDIFQDGVAIAFLDMRGLPPAFDAREALHCYHQQGLGALKILCAGYACVICDLHKQHVIFASDSLGHTTFFYHTDGERIIVSDALRPVSARVDPGIDQQSFDRYMVCGFIAGNRTICKNIYKLSPGGYIIVGKGRVRLGNYRKLPRAIRRGKERLGSELNDSLASSVRRTLAKPTGVMHSGGFDSSFLCQLVQSYQQQVRTYAIGSPEYNHETLDQGVHMARILGTAHTIINITLKEFAAALPLTVRLMDEPIFDLDTAAIYPALRKIPADVKFLLHGFGSDQLIGDFFKDRASRLFFIKGKMPLEARYHYRLNPEARARLVFPFLEQPLVRMALQIPKELRLRKKLLRSLAPSLDKIFSSLNAVQIRGQVPDSIRNFILKVHGQNLMQNRLLGDLMGRPRLSSVLSSGKTDEILKLVVFSLWARENGMGHDR